MELTGKKVLVTGGAGFIGSHLVERLVARGCHVRVLAHYNSFGTWGHLEELSPDALADVEIVSGDVGDPYSVAHAVEECSVVFHLAALIAIPYSYRAPASYVTVNVNGTLNVLEACRRYGVDRIVHTSTSETYGTARYTPIDEQHPLQGQSPYSASKIAADKLAEAYYRSFDVPVVILRPFNTFGPRQSARAVIPTVVTQALSRPEVKLGSLGPVRDLTFVHDTVSAFVAAAESDDAVGEVINAGNGQGITIENLALRILDLMGVGESCRIVTEEVRVRPEKSEVFELICDASRAGEILGWRPAVSLDEGLTRTIDYIRQNVDRYKADLYNV